MPQPTQTQLRKTRSTSRLCRLQDTRAAGHALRAGRLSFIKKAPLSAACFFGPQEGRQGWFAQVHGPPREEGTYPFTQEAGPLPGRERDVQFIQSVLEDRQLFVKF